MKDIYLPSAAQTNRTKMLGECPYTGKDARSKKSINPRIEELRGSIDAIEAMDPLGVLDADGNIDYGKYKEDTFALAAIIIPSLFESTFSQRKNRGPYGLLRSNHDVKGAGVRYNGGNLEALTPANGYEILESSLSYTLKNDLHNLPDTLKRQPGSETRDTVLAAHEKLGKYTKRIENKTTEAFISQGANTAADVMSNMLEVIEGVVIRDHPDATGDIGLLTRIAQENYRPIMELTYTNVTFFGKLLSELRGGKEYNSHQHTPFDLDAFVLSPHGRLLLTDEFLDGVIDKHRVHFDEWVGKKSPTLGCPAAYSSGIKDLWNWNVELAQNIWQRPSSDQRNPRHLYVL